MEASQLGTVRIKERIRNTWKVLKCGVGEGCRRTVGPTM
jgi:hypothetical protein